MNTPNRSLPSLLVPVLGLAGFLVSDLPAQVVIEGGPGVIQISDRDGEPEPVVPGGVPGGAPVPLEPGLPTAILVDPTPPSAIEIETEADPSVTVRVPVERPVPPARVREIAPAAAVIDPAESADPAVSAVDVAKAKRKAELVRALGIADSGTGATIAIDTENLYEEDTALVDPVAKQTLLDLAEFIRLSRHEGVTVTYQYSPSLHGEELAWKRSVSLIEWMKVSGALSETKFTIEEPVRVVESVPTPATGDGETALPQNRVALVIDYR